MSRIDALDLDGRLLTLLVTVVEQRSVTRAAERLGLTQSAVSHGLERLRRITGDALVVKSGRGIAPTPQAERLAEQARRLLVELQGLAAPAPFEPSTCDLRLCIAANPLQRDLLLPPLLRRLQRDAPAVSLRVLPSGVPTAEDLRGRELHLVISPRPPQGDDIARELLLEDRYGVFYDPGCRQAPAGRAGYAAAEHVTVRYPDERGLEIDRFLDERGLRRRRVVEVSDFSGVAPFVWGTARLATMPTRTAVRLLHGLACVEPPLPCPPMPMFMIWHRRCDAEPAQVWLRQALREVAAELA